jgi:hypothetical protein
MCAMHGVLEEIFETSLHLLFRNAGHGCSPNVVMNARGNNHARDSKNVCGSVVSSEKYENDEQCITFA